MGKKLVDIERLRNLGWTANTSLKEGIEKHLIFIWGYSNA